MTNVVPELEITHELRTLYFTFNRNWLLQDFISQCDRSTDSNNLKAAGKLGIL